MDSAYLQRYGRLPAVQGPWSPTIDLLYQHASVRDFLPDALPPGTLETLIGAAQSASTSSMLQTWSAVAVTDKTRKDALARVCADQDFIRQAPLFLVFCADLARLTAISGRLDLPGRGLQALDTFLVATVDAALAGQNAVVAAESLRLGACYVGAVRNQARRVSALLDLPPRVVALFGIAIGVPAGERPAVKPRLPLDEVLHRDTWKAEGQEERVREYDGVLGAFYDLNDKVGRGGWSKFMAELMSTGDLEGREELRHVLHERGFELE